MNQEIYNKKLLLTRVDFDRDQKPRLRLSDAESEKFYSFNPEFGQNITLKIDTETRYCIGWHNLETGEDFVCLERATVDHKYEQCHRCQQRTGFNPAFYNAAEGDISQQQQERNSQPHFVYLANFANGITKVGISYAGRGKARLVEQGARAALVLGEFPTANVARSYEARISALPGLCENVKASAKIKLLEDKFDKETAEKELLESRRSIEASLSVDFDKNDVEFFDELYAEGEIPSGNMFEAVKLDQAENQVIFSGEFKAQIGYILLAEQQGETIVLPARKFTGYMIEIIPEITELQLPERQVSLFDF